LKNFICPLVLTVFGLFPVIALAEMPIVPQTGQTTSYGTRDDGALRKGAVWPTPRFSDKSNGTVSDNLTGLIWLKDPNCFNAPLSWSVALASAKSLATGSCGLTDGSVTGDWRLPNRKELLSLVNRQQADNSAWLNSSGFANVKADTYWSSSTSANDTRFAWILKFSDGTMDFGNRSSSLYLVWPVRGESK
jgi:hypothetical protein